MVGGVVDVDVVEKIVVVVDFVEKIVVVVVVKREVPKC